MPLAPHSLEWTIFSHDAPDHLSLLSSPAVYGIDHTQSQREKGLYGIAHTERKFFNMKSVEFEMFSNIRIRLEHNLVSFQIPHGQNFNICTRWDSSIKHKKSFFHILKALQFDSG